MSKNKNIHNTGALAAVLSSGGVAAFESRIKKTSNSTKVDDMSKLLSPSSTSSPTQVIELEPSCIIRWEHKDRPSNELGDIEDLAKSMKEIGQQQPCIVRKLTNSQNKFELIVGERRWRASQLIGTKLKVLVHSLDNKTASLVQVVENEHRKGLSDYAKGMSYANKIELGYITQTELSYLLGVSKQQITKLLSFKKIPQPLLDSIKDFRKVSARTAYELVRISKKSDQHLQALISLADKIREGIYGHNSIIREVALFLDNNPKVSNSNKKVVSYNGKHIFTWRLNSSSVPSIHFPQDVIQALKKNDADLSDFTKVLLEYIKRTM